jgi:hypothetical protein
LIESSEEIVTGESLLIQPIQKEPCSLVTICVRAARPPICVGNIPQSDSHGVRKALDGMGGYIIAVLLIPVGELVIQNSRGLVENGIVVAAAILPDSLNPSCAIPDIDVRSRTPRHCDSVIVFNVIRNISHNRCVLIPVVQHFAHLETAVPDECFRVWNQVMMELGADGRSKIVVDEFNVRRYEILPL